MVVRMVAAARIILICSPAYTIRSTGRPRRLRNTHSRTNATPRRTGPPFSHLERGLVLGFVRGLKPGVWGV
eukprot:3878074-Pyramimonas_sp.AAC.1